MQMKFNYLILCLLLLLANDIPGCLKNSNDNNNHKGISGFQEINEAINHSVTFNNKFELIIIECKDHLTEGIFLKVTYIFVDIENYNWSVDHADYRELIIVFENNEIESKIKRASIPGPNPPDFGNISLLSNLHGLLDTPGAYNIAINNEVIKKFLNKGKQHSNLYLWHAQYGRLTNTWSFTWHYDDNPSESGYKRANIKIDARTGDVTYVRADGVD